MNWPIQNKAHCTKGHEVRDAFSMYPALTAANAKPENVSLTLCAKGLMNGDRKPTRRSRFRSGRPREFISSNVPGAA